jgi:hypothetical protein
MLTSRLREDWLNTTLSCGITGMSACRANAIAHPATDTIVLRFIALCPFVVLANGLSERDYAPTHLVGAKIEIVKAHFRRRT